MNELMQNNKEIRANIEKMTNLTLKMIKKLKKKPKRPRFDNQFSAEYYINQNSSEEED
jgi:hypothetical protein